MTTKARDLADELATRYDLDATYCRESVDTLLGQIWSIDGTDGDVNAISDDDAETIRDQFAADHA